MLEAAISLEDHGMVDPDTKPGNMMLRSNDDGTFETTKLDFGLCTDIEEGASLSPRTLTAAQMNLSMHMLVMHQIIY